MAICLVRRKVFLSSLPRFLGILIVYLVCPAASRASNTSSIYLSEKKNKKRYQGVKYMPKEADVYEVVC